MRKRPIIIALSVAGIIAGTHAGIAAISEATENVADPTAMQTEPQAVTEAQAPAEVQTPAESQAPVAQAPAESVVQPKWTLSAATEPQHVAANDKGDVRYVRLPFTSIRLKVTQSTFPDRSSEFAEPLPSVVAYFDRKNAGVVLAGAASPVFPGRSSEFAEPLPATVAYFDRIEAQRLASAQPATATMAQGTPSNTATDSQVTMTQTAPSPGT